MTAMSMLVSPALLALAVFAQVNPPPPKPPEEVLRAIEEAGANKEKKAQQPDWKQINGVEKSRRDFVLRRRDMPVGRGSLTVRVFQNGAILRTGLEFWAFGGERSHGKEHFWFQGFASELASSKAALAEWATGQAGDLGMNYRFQGVGKGMADFRGNLFDVGHRNPRRIRLPEGYRLLRALAHRLQEAFVGKGKSSFEWKRYIWREWEPTWHEYRYTYEGPDTVSVVGGSSLPAHRFSVKPVAAQAPRETLWVDQEGYLLRRVIKIGAADWEIIVTDQPVDAKTKFIKWTALDPAHRAEAETFLRTIGVWF